MPTVISVINWKGGVGKTTLTHHLATGIKHLNFEDPKPRVLIIDLDAQCNLSISCLGAHNFEEEIQSESKTIKDLLGEFFNEDDPEDLNIDDYLFKNQVGKKFDRDNERKYYKGIDLLASHPDLIYTDMEIASFSRPGYKQNLMSRESYKFKFLHNILSKLESDAKFEYDYVFIDCPPNLNFITQNAIYASHYYVIPTILDTLSTYGILSITNKVKELNKLFSALDEEYAPTKLLGIIPNLVVERSGEPKSSQSNRLSALESTFPDEIFDNYLTYGDGIARASSMGIPVYGLKDANATKQGDLLLDILIELLKRAE